MVVTIYTVDEICKMLESKGIKKTSVYRAISKGSLKSVKVGKRFLVSEPSLNTWLSGSESVEIEQRKIQRI